MAPHSLMYRVFLATSLLQFAFPSAAAPFPLHQIKDLTSPQTQSPTVNRRQGTGSTIPIVGITEFGIQPRLEIRQLEQHADQWNIYLLGLNRFMQTNETQKLSYYQIAG